MRCIKVIVFRGVSSGNVFGWFFTGLPEEILSTVCTSNQWCLGCKEFLVVAVGIKEMLIDVTGEDRGHEWLEELPTDVVVVLTWIDVAVPNCSFLGSQIIIFITISISPNEEDYTLCLQFKVGLTGNGVPYVRLLQVKGKMTKAIMKYTVNAIFKLVTARQYFPCYSSLLNLLLQSKNCYGRVGFCKTRVDSIEKLVKTNGGKSKWYELLSRMCIEAVGDESWIMIVVCTGGIRSFWSQLRQKEFRALEEFLTHIVVSTPNTAKYLITKMSCNLGTVRTAGTGSFDKFSNGDSILWVFWACYKNISILKGAHTVTANTILGFLFMDASGVFTSIYPDMSSAYVGLDVEDYMGFISCCVREQAATTMYLFSPSHFILIYAILEDKDDLKGWNLSCPMYYRAPMYKGILGVLSIVSTRETHVPFHYTNMYRDCFPWEIIEYNCYCCVSFFPQLRCSGRFSPSDIISASDTSTAASDTPTTISDIVSSSDTVYESIHVDVSDILSSTSPSVSPASVSATTYTSFPMLTRGKSSIFRPKVFSTKHVLSANLTTVIPPSTHTCFSKEIKNPNWKHLMVDEYTALKDADLTEVVYMKQAPGFVDESEPNHVCRLYKYIYGLKQTPKAWYEKLLTVLVSHSFQPSFVDSSLFVQKYGSRITIILLKEHFPIKDLGSLHYFLGLEVKRNTYFSPNENVNRDKSVNLIVP
ncbi:uncharacterized protein LOC113359421 [Papaver somniferum]|uniref:uncharacterized protein LOC113359421 n=1 Tax=Papaver somniferum TaxID=3469 RepID=UPI000E704070|nr:uncharacterized protein LOC113359421 [Papaver somniferum]